MEEKQITHPQKKYQADLLKKKKVNKYTFKKANSLELER